MSSEIPPNYIRWFDSLSGEYYYVRIGRDGTPSVEHVNMTKVQRALMFWAFWKYDQDWSVQEIYAVLSEFYEPQLGQPPLSRATIVGWLASRRRIERNLSGSPRKPTPGR